jgi:hypothetical protein
MANITRKQFHAITIAAIRENVSPVVIAEREGFTAEQLNDTANKIEAADARKRVSKPSAETLRNRQIATELAGEINARGAEFTAAGIAEFYTDPDGMTLTARKVGALLRQAVGMGLIAVSPEPWSVKHYAPVGFEFAKKPVRVKKSKDAENANNAK